VLTLSLKGAELQKHVEKAHWDMEVRVHVFLIWAHEEMSCTGRTTVLTLWGSE